MCFSISDVSAIIDFAKGRRELRVLYSRGESGIDNVPCLSPQIELTF